MGARFLRSNTSALQERAGRTDSTSGPVVRAELGGMATGRGGARLVLRDQESLSAHGCSPVAERAGWGRGQCRRGATSAPSRTKTGRRSSGASASSVVPPSTTLPVTGSSQRAPDGRYTRRSARPPRTRAPPARRGRAGTGRPRPRRARRRGSRRTAGASAGRRCGGRPRTAASDTGAGARAATGGPGGCRTPLPRRTRPRSGRRSPPRGPGWWGYGLLSASSSRPESACRNLSRPFTEASTARRPLTRRAEPSSATDSSACREGGGLSSAPGAAGSTVPDEARTRTACGPQGSMRRISSAVWRPRPLRRRGRTRQFLCSSSRPVRVTWPGSDGAVCGA